MLGSGASIRKDSPRRMMRERLLRGRRRTYHDHDGASNAGASNASYSVYSEGSASGRTSASGNGNGSNGASGRKFFPQRTGLNQRVDSGITSGRRNLNQVGSSDNSDPWDPHTKTFDHIRASSDPNAVISPFQNQEETVDFLTPELRRNHTKSFTLPPPSLVELESLASFSNASPSPENRLQDPSPVHPNTYTNHRVPSHMVLSSTLTSLREPGVRLSAHGTQCEPRRIWIQLEVHKELLEWRTENQAAKSGSAQNDLESSYTLGPKHTISLKDILYVDVGKTTAALQMLSEGLIRSDMCFSILTKNGSLDLTAGNRLERDALISCMCLVLDTVHADDPEGKSWRDLHISDGSVTSRSTGTFGGAYSRGAASSSSGYQGGTSSVGNYDYSPSEVPTAAESDVYAGIETIEEGYEF